MDNEEMQFLRDRLISKIKKLNEPDKLITFLIMADMTDEEVENAAMNFAKQTRKEETQ